MRKQRFAQIIIVYNKNKIKELFKKFYILRENFEQNEINNIVYKIYSAFIYKVIIRSIINSIIEISINFKENVKIKIN